MVAFSKIQKATRLEKSMLDFCKQHNLTGVSIEATTTRAFDFTVTLFWDGFAKGGFSNVTAFGNTIAGAISDALVLAADKRRAAGMFASIPDEALPAEQVQA